PTGWDLPNPLPATQEYGRAWIATNGSAVLSVPSAVLAGERNFVLNIRHPDFRHIAFGPSEPFQFDPRLKPERPGA
ncbi:MAG: hypothetical protein JWO48_1688, partial [Bryobacterales bacterium]|nr:hypothetical protein [Bryobacterales bacterium]